MVATGKVPQRIARLTSFADALEHVYRNVSAIAPRDVETGAALGRVLAAADVVAEPHPAAAIALRDGWAVSSEATLDAGSYAPAVLAQAPVPVQVGDPIPVGTDAVAPLDAVEFRGTVANALLTLAPGENVLACSMDAAAGAALLRAGYRISRTDLAVLAAIGLDRVSVREPRVRIAPARPGRNVIIDAILTLLVGAVEAEGGVAIRGEPTSEDEHGLDGVLTGKDADAVIIVGGSGVGARDQSVATLGRLGTLAFHGVGLAPGETAAFGMVDSCPVLVLPGRLDAALAAWLALGRYMLARLTARSADDPCPAWPAILGRKVTSSIGSAEVIVLRQEGGGVVPLGSGYLSLQALAAADGWFLIPADSEGIAAGAMVIMKSLP
jgi:molybdopterin molybdotransferase